MKKNRITISLVALATMLAVEGARAADQVALLISPAVYGALKQEIKQYKKDVEARFSVKLNIVEGKWKTPLEVRTTIKGLHADNGVSGIILVGALPMHRFFMHEHANPNPLYYEDYALAFIDKNKDGVDDAYKGKPQLKVWVANIRACERAQDDDIPGLRRFFVKTHDYYTGKAVPELRTILFSGSDWPGTDDWFRRHGGAKFSTPENVTMITGKDCTLEAARKAYKKHSYTLTYFGIHSEETRHSMEGGDLLSQEIADLTTGSLITINHGCFTGNWAKNDDEKSGLNCALSWAFGRHLGQAVFASVRSGGVGCDHIIYARLRAGDYVGKAYFLCKQATENESSTGDNTPGDIVSGVLFIGNPFLELKPVNVNARLVIKNAVYGDFENNVVTNVTQQVADWVDNNTLKVEIPNDDFGDPANGIVKQLKVDYTFDGKEKSKTAKDGETLKIER